MMRITRKRQITIPAEIRRHAGFLPGTLVELAFDGKTITISRADQSGRGARIAAHLRGRGDLKMSTDEIMALTRKP